MLWTFTYFVWVLAVIISLFAIALYMRCTTRSETTIRDWVRMGNLFILAIIVWGAFTVSLALQIRNGGAGLAENQTQEETRSLKKEDCERTEKTCSEKGGRKTRNPFDEERFPRNHTQDSVRSRSKTSSPDFSQSFGLDSQLQRKDIQSRIR